MTPWATGDVFDKVQCALRRMHPPTLHRFAVPAKAKFYPIQQQGTMSRSFVKHSLSGKGQVSVRRVLHLSTL
jgi:hypothetical protein